MSSKRKEPRNKVAALQVDWVSTACSPPSLKGSNDIDVSPKSPESLEGIEDRLRVSEKLARPLVDFLVVADRKPGKMKKASESPANEVEGSQDNSDQGSGPPITSVDPKYENIVLADRSYSSQQVTDIPAQRKDTIKDGDVGKGTGKLRFEEESHAILEEASVRRVMSLASTREPDSFSQTELMINLQEQEDEVLALEAIYEDKFRLLIKEEEKPTIYKISVPVDVSGSLEVLVELPASDILSQSDDMKEKVEWRNNAESSQDTSGASTSGRLPISTPGTTHSFTIQYIPPYQLTFTFPKAYPSSSPPIFSLSSSWLSAPQLSSLCKGLDHIWEDHLGQVVVYAWIEWLQSQTLIHLGKRDKLYLGPYDLPVSQERGIDTRAVSGRSSPENDIPFLLRYNEDMRLEEFYKSWHTCNICFTEQCGKDFVKLPCQHFFCWTCMEQYSSVHVKDGSVNKLNCPDTACRGSLPPFLLKELLGEDDFRRWEDLLLQKTLDSMIDVVYCPRCETVCIEDEDHHVQCGGCFFNFCSLCRAAWHVGQECMSAEARLRILQERQKGRILGDEQRKKEQDLVNEVLNLKYVNREAKLCPTCKMAISKTEGCNKMTCSNCGQYFCFRCGLSIEGYDHYGSGSCVLFEQADIEIWERQMNHRQLEAQARLELWPELGRPCPNCRQRNIKEGNNNHMFCWACQNHYCGVCNKMVRRAAEHYGPNKCRQHTAN
ncbi:hypothetical protein O6H91_13G061700 [Diphasiastrum complanatum]|uniref:Uncharacterized protein n=1 Tax=Diphasiastrum complanatum TaxID=34168 RepID=A0ACC2BVL4_DIPCM|nr:hypothetical protein O6H91_13G061700 [Diphasiastrum complanatum]